jgi:putative ABC transport system permease protein
MQTLWQDLSYGARMLFKQPAFTLVAIVTLALGIGANTAIFSVINALILHPPRVADPERVVAICRTPKDKRNEGYVSYPDLQDWRAGHPGFEAIAAYKPSGIILLNQDQAEVVPGLMVTANFLALLRVNLLRGRDFQFEEEKRGAPDVTIISHQFWRNRLGGSEAAMGQPLTMNGRSFTIIGVLPPDFEFPLQEQQPDLIITIAGEGGNLDQRGAQLFMSIGRLKPDVTLPEAQSVLTNIAARLEEQYPGTNRDATAYLIPLTEQIVRRDIRRALWLLLGAVGFLLLIACTNVANLLLMRATARQKELALRVALGASRRRVARQLLTESGLLSLLSAGAGLLLAMWVLSAIRFLGAEQLPRLGEVQINGRVLAFTLGVAVLTALFSGMLPVIKASRPDLNEVLKAGAKTATSGRSLRSWRKGLVVTEVALGLVLLAGAGLMMRSFVLLVNVSPGFDPQNVLTGEINIFNAAFKEHDNRVRYVNQTLDRLKALPGVESAAFIAPMPFSDNNVGSDFRIEGGPIPEPGREPAAGNRSVTAQYFQALRIPLRKGRYFSERDQRSGAGVAIINEALARAYFPNEEPIGRFISNIGANLNEGDPERWEIVGVVGDVHHSSLSRAPRPEIYLPYQQNSWFWGNFFVRTKHNAAALTKSFTEAVRGGDKRVPVTRVRLLTEAISHTVAETRFYTLLFVLFGVTGLLLTLTGIYSVVSYTVAQSTPEIGIRMALGAQARDVLKLVIGQGMLLAAVGIVIGLLAATALTRLMENLLFGMRPADPLTFGAIALLLAAVSLLACWIPARRATKVDPIITLRSE